MQDGRDIKKYKILNILFILTILLSIDVLAMWE